MSKKLSVSEIDEQIKNLQKARVEAAKSAKSDLKEKIDSLINDSDYSLEDLYPKLSKGSKSNSSDTVTINSKTLKFNKSNPDKITASMIKHLAIVKDNEAHTVETLKSKYPS